MQFKPRIENVEAALPARPRSTSLDSVANFEQFASGIFTDFLPADIAPTVPAPRRESCTENGSRNRSPQQRCEPPWPPLVVCARDEDDHA